MAKINMESVGMDAHQFRQLLQSTAAGSMILLSGDLVLGEHLVQFEPDRPQVSPACSPIWGYNRPCWRRFPDVPACDQYGCSTVSGHDGAISSQSIYIPQPQQGAVTVWSSEGPQLQATSKPLNVYPGNMNIGVNPQGPTPNSVAPSGTLPPVSGTTPMQPVIPSTDRPLPPLPSPPASNPSITPVPDPGAQQSRYSPATIWTPQNAAQTSRYGGIPATTISNRVVIPQASYGSIR